MERGEHSKHRGRKGLSLKNSFGRSSGDTGEELYCPYFSINHKWMNKTLYNKPRWPLASAHVEHECMILALFWDHSGAGRRAWLKQQQETGVTAVTPGYSPLLSHKGSWILSRKTYGSPTRHRVATHLCFLLKHWTKPCPTARSLRSHIQGECCGGRMEFWMNHATIPAPMHYSFSCFSGRWFSSLEYHYHGRKSKPLQEVGLDHVVKYRQQRLWIGGKQKWYFFFLYLDSCYPKSQNTCWEKTDKSSA